MTRSDPRRGIVLVAVLWMMALLAALAMAASVSFRSFAGIMAVDRTRLQGDALLTAGLEVAAGAIHASAGAPLRDLEVTVALKTGAVHAQLNDEGGRIDITKAPAEVIAALLRSAGAPSDAAGGLAGAVVERRGPRSNTRSAADVGGAMTTPEQALADLARISGMRAQWLTAIVPLVTVYGSETVNPLTAPRSVIAALPGVDTASLQRFLAERASTASDATRLVSLLGSAQRYLAAKPQRVAAVDLMASLTDGRRAAARAVLAVLPQDSEPYRVLSFTPVNAARLR